jgi:hypothetical protein
VRIKHYKLHCLSHLPDRNAHAVTIHAVLDNASSLKIACFIVDVARLTLPDQSKVEAQQQVQPI